MGKSTFLSRVSIEQHLVSLDVAQKFRIGALRRHQVYGQAQGILDLQTEPTKVEKRLQSPFFDLQIDVAVDGGLVRGIGTKERYALDAVPHRDRRDDLPELIDRVDAFHQVTCLAIIPYVDG